MNMRALIILMTILFAVSACGKKAPLRPPEEPSEQSLR
jgi:predicted small lipoprotein YifL